MRILSLGAGVQSSTLALMAEHGDIEKPNYAIFADTGWEPKHCYDWLDYLSDLLSFPVIRVSAGNIRDDLIANIETSKRFASIPFFTSSGGMGRRQCTQQYKLVPIYKMCRELLGYKPRQRIPRGSIQMLIGISTDEVHRMKPSRERWIDNVYPLIDLRMSRTDCLSWMDRHGYPLPPKSSCIGCPFHSSSYWADLKKNHPEEFYDAAKVDSLLRAYGHRTGMKNLEYMHPSLRPLSEIEFTNEQQLEIDLFGIECEGMCGV
ncbi:hypothetical protein [Nitrosomonas sp.]|uniref:hypothetical protein n=1 Tax=Nitrosomonas sp. TaxID=42353 RepID=UPI0037C9627A